MREAKILAFAVRQTHRRRGTGRALQERVIEIAKASELFQIRSHSGGESAANRALKLSLGFGVHPITRNGEKDKMGQVSAVHSRGRALSESGVGRWSLAWWVNVPW